MNLVDDAQLVKHIEQVTQGAARLLITLARRGKALQQDEPQRAAFLLAAVGTHPLYKGGRLAFDMMEIEDLMLDNPLVDAMSTNDVIRVLTSSIHYFAKTLRQMAPPARECRPSAEMPANVNDMLGDTLRASEASTSEVTGASSLPRLSLGPRDVPHFESASAALDEDGPEGNTYPELRSSDYLYDYVVLGFLEVIGGIEGSRRAGAGRSRVAESRHPPT